VSERDLVTDLVRNPPRVTGEPFGRRARGRCVDPLHTAEHLFDLLRDDESGQVQHHTQHRGGRCRRSSGRRSGKRNEGMKRVEQFNLRSRCPSDRFLVPSRAEQFQPRWHDWISQMVLFVNHHGVLAARVDRERARLPSDSGEFTG